MSGRIFTILLVAGCGMRLFCGAAGGAAGGIVIGPLDRPLPMVEIQIQNQDAGWRVKLFTDEQGRFLCEPLPAGTYKVTARQEGFRTETRSDVTVASGRQTALEFRLGIVPLEQSIHVESEIGQFDSVSAGVTLDRIQPDKTSVANGRDLHSYFDIAPGTLITPAVMGDGGQFSANGQRPNTNVFRVDGLNVNTGLGANTLPGAFPGSSLPGMSATGGTQNLTAPEEISRMELRVSDFSAEWSDRPGAQVLITTRSGGAELHGTLFGYARPGLLSANDWFANSQGYRLPKRRFDSAGAAVGGPLFSARRFFFFSFERSSLGDQTARIEVEPSASVRQTAAPAWSPILKAFPAGVRPLSATESEGLVPIHNSAAVTTYGLRVDQGFGAANAFFLRAVGAPSSETTDELVRSSASYQWTGIAGGLTFPKLRGAAHEAGFQFVAASLDSVYYEIPRYGAEPFNPGDFIPFVTLAKDPLFSFSIPGIGQLTYGQGGTARQSTWEAWYHYTQVAGRHRLVAGADGMRMVPRREAGNLAVAGAASNVAALAGGLPMSFTYFAIPADLARIYTGSFFVDDSTRLGTRTRLSLGVRWEITPPVQPDLNLLMTVAQWGGPGTASNSLPAAAFNSVAAWNMNYRQFAPRAGIAHQLCPAGVVVRAGTGVFYDTSLASAVNPVNGAPFNGWLSSSRLFASSGGGGISALPSSVPKLQLPVTVQWRFSIERPAGKDGVISAAYAGSAGRRLLRREAYADSITATPAEIAATSLGASTHHALQAHATYSLGPGTRGVVSYTWSHSIDNGSQDADVFLVYPGYDRRTDRGSSNFDARHVFYASLSTRVPGTALLRPLTSGWRVNTSIRLRSGFPFDVSSDDRALGFGYANSGRLDLAAHDIPVWLSDAGAPGGRRLNPAALVAPGGPDAGNLGRNALYGAALVQLDANATRGFRINERLSGEFAVSAFNLPNHASFSTPVLYRSSALFGLSDSMQSLMLGAGSPNMGLTPLFQAGAPRTVELRLRIQF